MTKKKIIISFFLIYGLCCFLSLNRHSVAKPYTYHSELWADKAGYNVYLPALFIYDFDSEKFPSNIKSKTGYGFDIDSVSKKIITKYPYGVALMQSPFWLMAHIVSEQKDGYSIYYQKSIDVSGSFYLIVGLFFLFFLIRNYKNHWQSILLTLLIALTTGIFYYGIFETGMSHVYSFCCFAVMLYVLNKEKEHPSHKNKWLLISISLLFLIIRPLNIIFLMPTLLFFIYKGTLKSELIIHFLKKPLTVFCLLVLLVLLIFPQLIYYNYAFGSFFTNSYKNEPFLFPSFMRIIEMLFSPNNGLLIYYPIILVLFFYSLVNKHLFNKLVWFTLVIYTLIYASWWSLSLGCGFGHRAINDIVLILFLPLIMNDNKINTVVLIGLIICSIINVKFMFSYDTCLYHSLNWNYNEYFCILFGPLK